MIGAFASAPVSDDPFGVITGPPAVARRAKAWRDPVIHFSMKKEKKMDRRVKPGDDDWNQSTGFCLTARCGAVYVC
jgi:hypothetical protein